MASSDMTFSFEYEFTGPKCLGCGQRPMRMKGSNGWEDHGCNCPVEEKFAKRVKYESQNILERQEERKREWEVKNENKKNRS